MRPGMSRLGRKLAAIAAGAARALKPGPKAGPSSPHPELRLMENMAITLRERLAAIEGFAEFIARRDGAHAASASRHICESSGELNRFLADLQDFARHEQGRLSLVEGEADAAELVEAALSACRSTAERADITILAKLADGVELRCDPARISGAIANIVLWLADLAPAGGIILLRLMRTPQGGAAVAVTGMADTLPEGDLFAPRSEAGRLTGFSLPVARRVTLLHAGELTVEQGAGGVITLYLVLPPGRVIALRHAEACERCAA